MSYLERPISPPPRKRPRTAGEDERPPSKKLVGDVEVDTPHDDIYVIPSPIRLYRIKDLPDSENADTVTLRELLSPQSTLDELWTINFMTDMGFLRGLIGSVDEKRVRIRILHGYWRQEDESRKEMEAGVWGNNVKLISAYLPDTFGTHHSKIIILFRTNDTAQVIVHTGTSLKTHLIQQI